MKNTLQRDNDEARRMAMERLEKPDFDQQQRLAGEDRPPLEETVEHKGSCLFAILGLILMLVIVFVTMHLDPPGRKTCLYCGDPISKGIYCVVHDVACQKCGRITPERNRGYCRDCYKAKYGLD